MKDDGGAIVIEPGFLTGPRGRLFFLHIGPADRRSRASVLFVPALADEQNKSRHVVSTVARAVARQGISVLLLDLSGTGDSDGEFSAVGWPDWVEDLDTALSWLRARADVPHALWAMRGGALLAALLAARAGSDGVRALMLWNPVLRGAQVASELSRLRAASEMLGREAVLERSGRVPDPRSAVVEPIDVGGYVWSPELLDGIKKLDLVASLPTGLPLFWLELARDPDRGPVPAVLKAIDARRSCGESVEYLALPGAGFWNSVELEWPTALMAATVERIPGLVT